MRVMREDGVLLSRKREVKGVLGHFECFVNEKTSGR